jgi:hypothetical protein
VAVAIAVTLAVSLLDAPPTSAVSTRPHGAVTNCGSPSTASAEPSGVLPLGPYTFTGWTRSYCNDFAGTKLPKGWDRFSGVPKGDPDGLWATSHVTVSDGVLSINTYRDPAYGDAWVSGGVCECGHPLTYGAFYVRSRLTSGGTSGIELLWPKDNQWPPEVDFFESWQHASVNTFTVHYSSADHIKQGWLHANLSKWHTWGVIWLPHEIEFVIDWGVDHWEIWGRITSRAAIPAIPMTLDLQQQTWCGILPACPTRPSSLLVDWVEEFVPDAPG